MSRYGRWAIAGIYLFSLPFMRRAWDLTGGKHPFLSNAVPIATGVVLLLILLGYLVWNKRESRKAVWFSLAAVCVVYALMFRALPSRRTRKGATDRHRMRSPLAPGANGREAAGAAF